MQGVKWNAINSIISQATTAITGIVLMRLLNPDAFGLIGMITVFTGFLNVLKDSGLSSSLIYQDNLKTSDKDTVFWFNIVVGFILSIGFYFSAGFIAMYYNEPVLDKLVKAFSVNFAITSFSNIQYGLLKKQLAFKKIFQAEVAGLIISASLAVIAAYLNFGVWSLIVLHISRSLFIAVNLWIVSEYKPSFQYSFVVLKKHFQYSFPVLGTKSFNYWTRNADNFFIGSFLGSQALGFYSRAYFFVTMPVNKISNVIGNVLFPSLSIIKNKKDEAAELYLKSMRITSFITFPLIGGLIVFAEPFTLVLFGSQWLPMVPVLQILSILSLLSSVFVYTTSIYYAQGATALHFKISMLYGICNISVFYIGSHYSIEMVGILLLIVFLVFLIPKLYFACKLINLKLSKVFKNLGFTFSFNAVCMLSSYLFLLTVSTTIGNVGLLIFGVLLYAIIFVLFNIIFNRIQSKEFSQYVLKMINN